MKKDQSFLKDLFEGALDQESLKSYPFFLKSEYEDFDLIAESVCQWIQQEVDSDEVDKEARLSEAHLASMKEMGLFGLIIPEEFGGLGFTQTQYSRLLELMNALDSSLTITTGAHSSIGLKALYLSGSEEQKKLYFPRLASGEMIAAFALTEPGAGSDAAGIQTRAVREGDHYLLKGTKLWITNGGFADFFTVFAKEEIEGKDRITAFIVTRDMGGVTSGQEEHKLGIKGSSTVEIHLEQTKVPLDHVLGNPGDGFKIAMHVLNQGRIGLAAGAIGPMKRSLEIARTFAKERKAFGSSILEFELIQDLILQSVAQIYSAEAVTYFTTHIIDQKSADYSLEAAAAKVYATEASWDVINRSTQILGGNGYMRDYVVERLLRDARIGLIFEGTNEILKQYIALTGLKGPAAQLKNLTQGIKATQESLKSGQILDAINQAVDQLGLFSSFAAETVKKQFFSETPIGFAPELTEEVQRILEATRDLHSCVFFLLRTHGKGVIQQQVQLDRLASIAIETYKMSCVISRCQTSLSRQLCEPSELALVKKIMRESSQKVALWVKSIKGQEGSSERKELLVLKEQEASYPFDIGHFKV